MAKILQSTSMPISSLPNSCSQKSMLLSYVNDPSSAYVNIVLTLDGGQFVGYIGYPDKADLKPELSKSGDILYHCNKIRTNDQVARLGDRLSADARDDIFPHTPRV
jgi:hypothetical protein